MVRMPTIPRTLKPHVDGYQFRIEWRSACWDDGHTAQPVTPSPRDRYLQSDIALACPRECLSSMSSAQRLYLRPLAAVLERP